MIRWFKKFFRKKRTEVPGVNPWEHKIPTDPELLILKKKLRRMNHPNFFERQFDAFKEWRRTEQKQALTGIESGPVHFLPKEDDR